MSERRRAKYQAVEAGILEWIRTQNLTPGDRLPTEAQIAERFGVSRLTVRHAVGNLVLQGLLSREQGRGTFYRGAATDAKPTKMIAFIATYINDYIFPSIVRGAQERLDREGYALLLFGTGNDPAKEAAAIETIRERKVDGLIIEPSRSMLPNPNVERLKTLIESGLPVVSVHARYDGLDVPAVEVNDVGGGELVAEHLAALGHDQVGMIMKLDDIQGSRRLQGFLAGATTHGLRFHAAWCRLFTTESKRTVARLYVERLVATPLADRPTAVFCYNDEIAIDLIQHLYRVGLSVPDDLSVVGFDDAPLAAALPMGLTTVVHPKVAMGERVAEWILDAIQGRPVVSEVFPSRLVARGTTRPRMLATL